ncbi:MAG: hypothetical protein FJ134_06760 [Deltaproteobacteria bacterium]|nr:hypothetical protein [Deltaproteobacteria bacterium]
MACKGVIQKDYFNLPELAAYSGLGIRFLRDALKDPEHPLPHFRMNNKTILVCRLEFAEWLERFRADSRGSLNQLVEEVMEELSNKKPRQGRPGRKQKSTHGVC